MKIPQFSIAPGKYTEVKFYDNEILNIIKALKHFQADYPKNSWTRTMIAFLENQKYTEVTVDGGQ